MPRSRLRMLQSSIGLLGRWLCPALSDAMAPPDAVDGACRVYPASTWFQEAPVSEAAPGPEIPGGSLVARQHGVVGPSEALGLATPAPGTSVGGSRGSRRVYGPAQMTLNLKQGARPANRFEIRHQRAGLLIPRATQEMALLFHHHRQRAPARSA